MVGLQYLVYRVGEQLKKIKVLSKGEKISLILFIDHAIIFEGGEGWGLYLLCIYLQVKISALLHCTHQIISQFAIFNP